MKIKKTHGVFDEWGRVGKARIILRRRGVHRVDNQMTLDGSMSSGLVNVLVLFSGQPFCTSSSVSGPASWTDAEPVRQAARTCCKQVRPSWSTALALALHCKTKHTNTQRNIYTRVNCETVVFGVYLPPPKIDTGNIIDFYRRNA